MQKASIHIYPLPVYISNVSRRKTDRRWFQKGLLSLLTSVIETGWDLGPSAAVLQSLHLTHLSSSNKRQRDYMGLKIALCMRSWGKFSTKRYKDKKNIQLPFLKSGEQKPGCRERKSPSTEPHKGWAKHPSHPSSRTPTHLSPHPCKQ